MSVKRSTRGNVEKHVKINSTRENVEKHVKVHKNYVFFEISGNRNFK